MEKNKDLVEFELIITLKAKIFDVNLNFLDKEDLEDIQDLAYDLGIEDYLTYFDLEPMYNSQYDEVKMIYNKWCDDIYNAYENHIQKLNKRLNDN